MYESFYGFRERPFDLSPNPRFLFFTDKHQEAMANLEFGITRHKGVVLLLGEAGMGKTTVVRALIEKERPTRVKCVYLNNPVLTREEFLQFLVQSLNLSSAAETSKTQLITELAERLTAYRRKGRSLVLLVDEAQSLPDELLEEIRLLTNIETNEEKLLTLILIGQPELADRLNDDALRQLKQRIELRYTLKPLDLRETASYIASRISTAGADSPPFTREAVNLIHERSRGIPRLISVICENALISGYAENERLVTRRLVQDVCDDFDLRVATASNEPSESRIDISPIPERQELPVDPPIPEQSPLTSDGNRPAVGDILVSAIGRTLRRAWVSLKRSILDYEQNRSGLKAATGRDGKKA
jgi:general secretion pathway protein A